MTETPAWKKRLPNQLSVSRLFLAGGCFALLNCYRYTGPGDDSQVALLISAVAVFIAAAVTDALDGYLARRWNVVSMFGRIIDPVADKTLILGAFIYLAGPRFAVPGGDVSGGEQITGVYPWMVVVILLRELGVTSLRAAMESAGIDFSARWSGKLKMIFQTIVVPAVLLLILAEPTEHPWAAWARDALVWATVLVTAISGLPYITGAMRAARANR